MPFAGSWSLVHHIELKMARIVTSNTALVENWISQKWQCYILVNSKFNANSESYAKEELKMYQEVKYLLSVCFNNSRRRTFFKHFNLYLSILHFNPLARSTYFAGIGTIFLKKITHEKLTQFTKVFELYQVFLYNFLN